MSILRPATPAQINLGLLLIRVVTGVIFVAHGAQKLFSYGIENVAAGFTQAGVPLAGLLAPTVPVIEFAGGLALIAGLLTRPVGLVLAAVMVGAGVTVHRTQFFLPVGYEYTLVLGAIVLMLALTGAGGWSADAKLARPEAR